MTLINKGPDNALVDFTLRIPSCSDCTGFIIINETSLNPSPRAYSRILRSACLQTMLSSSDNKRRIN